MIGKIALAGLALGFLGSKLAGRDVPATKRRFYQKLVNSGIASSKGKCEDALWQLELASFYRGVLLGEPEDPVMVEEQNETRKELMEACFRKR